MKHLKLFNESFMSDYQKLSDDFDKVKLEFDEKRNQLWKENSQIIDQIFYDLEDYKNNFFEMYRSSTGGYYDNYLVFLQDLFTNHYGDKDWYNLRLKNENFDFSCWEESKLDQFLDSCSHVMSLFGQLHDSFTLHLSIRWCDKTKYKLSPLSIGTTPTIPSEGMSEFIKNNLRKDDIEEWKKSLILNVQKIKDSYRGETPNIECGFIALFHIQVK